MASPSDFFNAMSQFDVGAKRVQNAFDNAARSQAGRAMASGDAAGGQNMLYRAGLFDEAGQVQDRQYRNEYLQYQRDNMKANVEDKQRERQAEERKERIGWFKQAAGALGQIRVEGDQTGKATVAARRKAMQTLVPTFKAMGLDDAAIQQLQMADLSDNSLRMFTAEMDKAEVELVKGEHGQLDLYNKRTQTLKPLRGPQPYMEGGYLFSPQGEGGSPASGGQAAPTSAPGGNYRDAIANIESRGNGDYKAQGPVTSSGDRAYGRYQVMGANIPQWTKEVLGRAMTPQEFLADPKAQDAVFDAKFGEFAQKYGSPEDAASVWFTGKPRAQGANRRDQLGTSGAEYVQKFASNMTQAPGTPATASDVPQIPGWTVQRMKPEDGWSQDPSNPGFLINNKGDVKADPRAPKPKENDPSKIFTQENQLRTGYGQQPAVKDLASVASHIGTIGAIAAKARENPGSVTAQDDLALIFAFMKMLDPGSVVREGEFANAQNTAGVPDRIVNMYNRALKGTRLTDRQRAEFFNTATTVMDNYTNRAADQADRYRGITESYGLTPDRVAPAIRRPKPRGQAAQPSAKAPPKPGAVVKGYRFNGGDPSKQSSWTKV